MFFFFFFWNLCSLTLPTKDSLQTCHVCLVTTYVLFLASWRRLLFMFFVDCVFGRMVWVAYGRHWGCTDGVDLVEWLKQKFHTLSQMELTHFITICWAFGRLETRKFERKLLLIQLSYRGGEIVFGQPYQGLESCLKAVQRENTTYKDWQC